MNPDFYAEVRKIVSDQLLLNQLERLLAAAQCVARYREVDPLERPHVHQPNSDNDITGPTC
jgi:hypothetical protein